MAEENVEVSVAGAAEGAGADTSGLQLLARAVKMMEENSNKLAEEKVEVLSHTLSESSLQKLTLPRAVLQKKIHLFPPELSEKGQAKLTFLKDGNEEILAVVTVSRQSVLTNPRLVFLQKEWKKIVEKLCLKKGDQLSIYLVDRRAWTYSIKLGKATTAERQAQVAEIDEASVADAAEGAKADTSGLQLLADCAVKMMEETSNKPALRPLFDLNLPPMETEL